MREIKFRAWAEGGKQMFVPIEMKNPLSSVVGGVTYMQFTGLHDKDGKEIYEGDIYRLWTAGNPKAVEQVMYVSGSPRRCAPNGALIPRMSGDLENSAIEIIGNIYENPELLTDK